MKGGQCLCLFAPANFFGGGGRCGGGGGHLGIQRKQLFQPLGVVFKAAANVDAG